MRETELMGEHHALKDVPKDGVIFDVGCNRGDWSHMAIEHCAPRAIHCFEPVPGITDLKEPMHLHHVAMGESQELRSLNLYADHSKSTFFRKTPDVERRHARYGVQHQGELMVHVETVDNFCDAFNIQHIDYLKIDAEGSDLAVLRGSMMMLRDQKIDRLQFEYGGCWQDAHEKLHTAFLLLSAMKYQVRKITPQGLGPVLLLKADEGDSYEYSNYYAEKI